MNEYLTVTLQVVGIQVCRESRDTSVSVVKLQVDKPPSGNVQWVIVLEAFKKELLHPKIGSLHSWHFLSKFINILDK